MSLLPYHEVHEGDGPYLLMVHGMLSSRAQWMLNVEALKAVASPVLVELWGHGRSPVPDDPALYHPDGYVACFERLREKLGAERWLLCGQSFGAGLTLRYALMHPERVIAQVFTNTNGGLADAETVRGYRENAKARAALAAEGLAGLERIPVHPIHARRLPEEVKAALLADAAMHKPEAFEMTFRYSSPHISVRERVAENRVPTLLVSGEREAKFQPVRDFAAAAMPMTEVVDLVGGHGVNIQAAEAFNETAIAFFRRHLAGEAARAEARR
jgi:pimeloyl-ACP methyl ester carboxylesterase